MPRKPSFCSRFVFTRVVTQLDAEFCSFFFIYSSCFLSTRRRASALSGWAGAEALSGWAGVTKGALQRDQSGKHDYRGAAKEPYQEQTSPAKEPEESAL